MYSWKHLMTHNLWTVTNSIGKRALSIQLLAISLRFSQTYVFRDKKIANFAYSDVKWLYNVVAFAVTSFILI